MVSRVAKASQNVTRTRKEFAMPSIENAKVAILATDGFEKSELFEPKRQLEKAGANVMVVSLKSGEIKSWDDGNWGDTVTVDKTIDEVHVEDIDALVLPGGQINPDILRTHNTVVAFVKKFFESGKTLAAICHAPWLLVEANVLRGRDVTSYHSIKTDVMNAGANWHDKAVVTDAAMITSRHPGDLDAFFAKIVEEIEEGRHLRTAA
jgi:protease I